MRGVGAVVIGAAAVVPVTALALMATGVAGTGGGTSPSAAAATDIPPEYLRLYGAAAEQFDLGPAGWSVLAGVGKVECDHGRSAAVGCHRGEANAAGARGPAQFLASTWASFGVDADGDGARDVYAPADAIFGMANYLHASGAPLDWRGALFAYNHSDAYVEDVLRWAQRYAADDAPPVFVAQPLPGGWLAGIPGATGIRCDARIVPDVVALERAYGLRVTACFGGQPHAVNGEHPLGLAIDVVPADGDWARTARLASGAGWSPSCAAVGCAGRGPFRLVLYNGYPGHGDPAHSSSPHLHLSWQHAPAAPFTRAAWVRTLLAPQSCGPSQPNNSRRSGAGGGCRG